MTQNNASIHVLADETLGGIKREYVEVGRDVSARRMGGYVQFTETPNLEPTDIIHIGTQRYELTDRKAEVGEKVIIVALDPGLATESDLGKVTTVTKLYSEDDIETAKLGWVKRSEYRVLVPVEAEADEPQPADPIFAIGNVAQEVAKLKRTVERLENEIDTLHKDNRTLGEELARLKEPKETEELAPIDAPLVFVQRKIGDAFDVYQDGKKLRGVRHIRIDAAVGEFTTHDIECFTGAESEEERP